MTYWCAYFLTWCEMKMHYVDAQLFDYRDMTFEAMDAECRMYECQCKLSKMRLNKKYGSLR